MRKKRLADWLEKISAAFMVGSVLTDKGFFLAIMLGLLFFGISMWLTGKGE